MSVIFFTGALLIATASVNSLFTRRGKDPLARHERALAALRDLNEHPHVIPDEAAQPPEPPTDHVHILSEPPADAAAHRRRVQRAAAAKRAAERRRPRDVADRPTAANLPTTPSTPRVAQHAAVPAAAPPPTPTAPPSPGPTAASVPGRPAASLAGAGAVPVPAPARVSESAPFISAPPPDRTARTRAIAAAAVAAAVVIAATTAALSFGGAHSPKRASAPPPPPTSASAPKPRPRAPVAPAPRPDIQFVASATGNGTVTVTVPFILTLTATGACWVSVQTDTGQSLFEGTLQGGQQQHVTGVGPLIVRLGNSPAMQLGVNGQQLSLAGVARTANVRFVPPT